MKIQNIWCSTEFQIDFDLNFANYAEPSITLINATEHQITVATHLKLNCVPFIFLSDSRANKSQRVCYMDVKLDWLIATSRTLSSNK